MESQFRRLKFSLATIAALLVAPAQAAHDSETNHSATEAQGDQQEREGAQLSQQLGRFKTTGDRLTFVAAGSERQYLGLENLALERVGKVLADRHDASDTLQWEVSGVLTEYQGTNYLLVTHAVLKSKGARGAAALTSGAQ